MKDRKKYISLKLKGSNAYHQNGERLKTTERIVNIGETADCDIRFETDGLVPEYYASIIQNEDGCSWRIVKRSQHIDIALAGKGTIGYAHQLKDGDLIQFGNQPVSLCFHQHDDTHYDEETDKDRYWQGAVMALLGLIAVIAVFFSFAQENDSIVAQDVEPLEESIFLIKVDSVCRELVANSQTQRLQPMKVLAGEAPTGTAFLTTDGTMVTARHCVEYWIGTNLDLTTKVGDLNEDDIVRWAIETETFNQTHPEDSTMQLRVFFSLYDLMGNKRYVFDTADSHVHINKDRDGVFMLADFSQDYYWRSIRPYFTDRQMELGDILWIDSLEDKGKVTLAAKQDLEKIEKGTRLIICGFPMTGIGDKRMTSTEGTIRRTAAAESENFFFESNINHGFSGGPVFMKSGNDIVAIGVVSRVDSISNGLYKWAVPVTEVISEK